ncbi:MAG: glycoside hydrolase family 3 C-terminal domain-containing protein [Paludibacter sp.]|nr:glycoside hydrolase family 3 C-terminal domain-containing protein [Paludibacter sp.]
MKRVIYTIYIMFFIFSIDVLSQNVQVLNKDNIDEIIKLMTLDEKVKMLSGVGDIYNTSKEELIEPLVNGQVAATFSIPRLGIVSTVTTDGPAGVKLDTIQKGIMHKTYATCFPSATTLASTWNLELVEKIGRAMGNETLEFGSDALLGPGINIQRNPLTGRNFEYFSEDPVISGEMGAAVIAGIQSQGVSACVKHFAANNIETNRMSINAVISQRALREIYLRGFERAIKKSNPWMLMTAYNKLNGYYTPEHPDLLKTILRDEWKYDGLVVTDWGAGKDHPAQMRAGNELMMPGHPVQSERLIKAVNSGKLDEKVIDQNVKKVLEYVVKTPRFRNYKYSNKPNLILNATICREAASEGIVLLKNKEETLPLRNKVKKIALFGKNSYHLIVGGTGSGRVIFKYAAPLSEALENVGMSISKPLANYYKNYNDSVVRVTVPTMKVRTRNIIDFAPEPSVSKEQIEQIVKKTDVAILTIGRNAGELWDRDVNGYFKLSSTEMELVRCISEIYKKNNKKFIVILNIGGPIEVESWRDCADAIVLAWQPGQEGAYALVDILKGNVTPSGKLAVTFPRNYEDVPSSKSFPGVPEDNPVNAFYEEGIYVGYRYYDSFNVMPAYEFGYGLSYTNFSYSPLILSSNKFDKRISVYVTIKNTGKTAGKETVQLYLNAPSGVLEKPEQELKDFAKTNLLKPGEVQQLEFNLDLDDLASFHTGKSQWIAEQGKYEVSVGSSSRDIRSKSQFVLERDVVVEQTHDVLYPNFLLNELTKKK